MLATFAECLRAERPRYGPCFECGEPATFQHHVIPQSRGGIKTVPLCGRCHGRVHNFTVRSDDHAQLTKEGLAAVRAQGRPIGRPAVGDRPELGNRIRGMREDGMTLQAICDQLNAEGVPTARGASVWRPSSVQSILGYERRPRRRRIANLPEIRRRTALPSG